MMKGFNYKKAVQALNILAEKSGGSINKMKAIKLVWFADRFHLRKYGRTITGDVYFALPFGPVPSTTRDILETNSFSLTESETTYSQEFLKVIDKYNYQTQKSANLKVFSKTDIESIEKAFEHYGQFNQFELSEISHEFPEWKRYEDALKRKTASRFLMDFEDFFKEDAGDNSLYKTELEELELIKRLYLRTDNDLKDDAIEGEL